MNIAFVAKELTVLIGRLLRSVLKSLLQVSFVISVFAFIIVIIAIIVPYLSTSPYKSYLSIKYGIPVDHIVIDSKPHDCEWSAAPLGNKYCHYNPIISRADKAYPDGGSGLYVTFSKVQD